MSAPRTYVVITPAFNECANLSRLHSALASQTAPPTEWVIVDTGSTDGTDELAERLALKHDWIQVVRIAAQHARGGPIVAAFNVGVATADEADVVVKVDADVSFDDDYFERLLDAFQADESLGIASGSCFELQQGAWLQRHVTGDHVWGACRAYRKDCLSDVSPLEERMGWDGIDALKARARGWRTSTIVELAFRHHRGEGSRDKGWAAAWLARGNAAHYMGYRPSFLLARAFHHATRDPKALMMIVGWLRPFLHREPRCSDSVARDYLRRQQRLRELHLRAREVRGKPSGAGDLVSRQ